MACFVVVHLLWTPRPERQRELVFLLAAGSVGSAVDSLLHGAGFIAYPTSHAVWTAGIVPPWITCLWVGFATMPRFSLAWLTRLPWPVAAGFGAVGGGLAFFAGTRLGAIEAGMGPWTYGALAVEYAVLTPLLVFGHRGLRSAQRPKARPPEAEASA